MYLDRYTLILSPLHTRVSSCNRWDHVWGTADDTSVVCSTNGSIDLDNFPRMAYHFVKRLPKGFGKGGKPTILIMDGHSSRWSPSALRMLRDNNVHVWVIASHSSAWGQVGDVGPNSKLSKHYNNQARKWRAAHPLYKMKCHHFNAIFTKAYDLYARKRNAGGVRRNRNEHYHPCTQVSTHWSENHQVHPHVYAGPIYPTITNTHWHSFIHRMGGGDKTFPQDSTPYWGGDGRTRGRILLERERRNGSPKKINGEVSR